MDTLSLNFTWGEDNRNIGKIEFHKEPYIIKDKPAALKRANNIFKQDNNYSFNCRSASVSEFYVNNEAVYVKHGNVCGKIFEKCYGPIQIKIKIEGSDIFYISDICDIKVPQDSPLNKCAQNMTKYVNKYSEQLQSESNILASSEEILNIDGSLSAAFVDVNAEHLADIAEIFEKNYRFFKLRSQFSIAPKEYIGSFDRLKYISADTVNYIIQHPDNLYESDSNGIRIGSSFWIPDKTLIVDNKKTYDIYENRVILSFLKMLIPQIEKFKNQQDEKDCETLNIKDEDDYVISSYYLYSAAADELKNIKRLYSRLINIYRLYCSLFNDIIPERLSVIKYLHLTHIFRSVPHYYEIYKCINKWFNKISMFDFKRINFMLSFYSVDELYEVYLLAKFINYFKSEGYQLIKASKINYISPKIGENLDSDDQYHSNKSCCNCFKFKCGNSEITLYYEPVIYSGSEDREEVKKLINEIGLFRNTSLEFPKHNKLVKDKIIYDSNRGCASYYTPDYVIKFTNSNSSVYIICDAKFKCLDILLKYDAAELIFKYLFSIAPAHENEDIASLYVFNGKWDFYNRKYNNEFCFNNSDGIKNNKLYDRCGSRSVKENLNIVTVSGYKDDYREENFACEDYHMSLLKKMFGYWISEYG